MKFKNIDNKLLKRLRFQIKMFLIFLILYVVLFFLFGPVVKANTLNTSDQLYLLNSKLIQSGQYQDIFTNYVLYNLPQLTLPKHHLSQKEEKKLIAVIGKINPYISLYERTEIAKYILYYTNGYRWPNPIDVASVMCIESTFYRNAKSPGNSIGLMQISLSQWKGKIPNKAFATIRYNIKYGIRILRENYLSFHQDPYAALLSYNSGSYAYTHGYAVAGYFTRFQMAKRRIRYLMSLV